MSRARGHILRAAVVGASSESIHAIRVAHDLGIRVVALDGNPQADGLASADESHVVDITVPELVIDALGDAPDVVLPVPIGRYLTSTGVVNDHYHLPGVTAVGARNCTDKYRFHQLLEAQRLRSSFCILVPSGGVLAQMPPSFPVVVKPRFGSGSRAVVICETWSALQRHLGQALPADEDMLVEEFAAGVEYGMDAAVVGGRLEVILLREKIITPLPYRQAVGYYSVADSDRDALVKERANTMMQAVVEVLGFESCLLHADLLWDGASMFVVEVSARPSGHHLHDLFTPLATGVDPVREFTKFAVPSLGLGYSFQPMATRSLLIRYFDFRDGTVVSVPRLERVREDFPLVKYEEHCLGKHMDRVTDGPTLMQRGYFILEGESRAQLESDSARLLKQFVVEKD